MCAISIVAKLRELRVPMKRPINTKSSMSDTPVTISGFIIGILVTVITELLKAPRLILNIATADNGGGKREDKRVLKRPDRLAGGEKLGIPFERKSLENRCRSRRIEREEHHHEKRRVDKQEHKRGKNLTEKLHHTTSLSASSEAKRFIIAMLISIITISTSDIDAPRL